MAGTMRIWRAFQAMLICLLLARSSCLASAEDNNAELLNKLREKLSPDAIAQLVRSVLSGGELTEETLSRATNVIVDMLPLDFIAEVAPSVILFPVMVRSSCSQACKLAFKDWVMDVGLANLVQVSPPHEGEARRHVWRMLDAWGKPEAGIFRGQMFWMGNRQACQRVVPEKFGELPTQQHNVQGQYCLPQLNLPESLFSGLDLPAGFSPAINIGICFPDSCDGEDVQKIFNALLELPITFFNVDVSFNNTRCDYAEKDPLSFGEILALLTMAFLMTLSVLALLFDMGKRWNRSSRKQLPSIDKGLEIEMEENAAREKANAIETVVQDGGADGDVGTTAPNGISTLDRYHSKQQLVGGGMGGSVVSVSRSENWASSSTNFISKVLLCFSPLKIASEIFHSESSAGYANEGGFEFLHGVRVLSLLWAFAGLSHEIFAGFAGNLLDLKDIDSKRVQFMGIIQSGFAADTFLFLAGFLLAYHMLRRLQKENKSLRWYIGAFVHRWIRITPTYMLVVFLLATIIMRTLRGSMFLARYPEVIARKNTCVAYWWTNLLYVNNFVPDQLNHKCFDHGWILAVIMQLVAISIPLIYILHRWRKPGYLLVSFLAIGSSLAMGLLSNAYKEPLIAIEKVLFAKRWGWTGDVTGDVTDGISTTPAPEKTEPDFRYMDHIVQKPYTRATPYLIGLLMGAILINMASQKSTLQLRMGKGRKFLSFVLWAAALVLWVGCILFMRNYMYGLDTEWPVGYSAESVAVFHAVSHFVFSAVLAWVVFACATGMGGPINTFLSWGAFRSLSRLTFCAYLACPAVIVSYMSNQDASLFYGFWTTFYVYLGGIVISYIMAFGLALIVEYPIKNLERVLLGKEA